MTISRRQFVGQTAVVAALMGLHQKISFAGAGTRLAPRTRLRHLRLHTTTTLEAMEHFYADVLELPIRERARESITIDAGETRLTYQKRPAEEGAPWYHVAFNIPENKIVSAHDWQKERTPLDNNPGAPRHPDHPDIVHFAHWDAHSVFFRDPAGNLLEHIARHTLDYSTPGPFTSSDIRCCSEIAIVLDAEDIRDGADAIGEEVGLGRYRTSSPGFVALGDENGLVLIMRKGVSMRGQAGVFPTNVEIDSPEQVDLEIEGFPYAIASV